MGALECWGVLLVPGGAVYTPGASAGRVAGEERGGGELEVVIGEPTEVELLAEFGPGLGLELVGVFGSDHAAAVFVGHEGPHNKLGHGGRFANAVARGRCFLDSALGGEEAELDA